MTNTNNNKNKKKSFLTVKLPKKLEEFYNNVYKPESNFYDIGDYTFEEFVRDVVSTEYDQSFSANEFKESLKDASTKLDYLNESLKDAENEKEVSDTEKDEYNSGEEIKDEQND